MLLSIDDPILPYPFLKMCLESYAGTLTDPNTCPYISPIKASDEVLSKFPKTKIMIASNDPLRDESFKFTLRLMYA
jgi:hormone-sensitive lipase